MRAPLGPPMVPRRATAHARRRAGSASGGQPFGDPRRGQGGGEDGVGAVDRPAIVLVEPDRRPRACRARRGCRTSGWSGRPVTAPVDGDPLAPHQAERLVHRTERVGAQRHRTEDLAGPHVDLDAPPRAVAEAEVHAGPHPPPGTRRGPDPCRPGRRRSPARARPPAPRPSRRRAGRATPAARPPRPPRPRTPGHSSRRPRHQRLEVGRARRAPDADDAGPVGTQRDASGGRLGPRRTTSSRRHSTRTAAPVSSASSRARGGHRAVALAPEGAAVGQRRGRAARRAGTSWRPARHRPARPTSSAA